MQGEIRVQGRVARMTIRLEVDDPAAGVDVTDVMLQPGGNPSGWLPHVTEMQWSAGAS
ncbi:hypothetical protein CZ674_06780 [Agrococcus casei LMG 22410]|uniref:Uncharacterized protein n=1 Tax=Agrococcus casei LMG 22410 TaxID=1255656 RepID=A0A1R4FUP3_9MICO|nr:hypothetical protein CZ674_06780 [Agrococcus casei LMG 22410]